MTGKTVGNDGTRRPVRRLAWGNAGRRRSRVSVSQARRPIALALSQAMVGAVLVAGLSVASPVASAASQTEPATSDEAALSAETTPADEDSPGNGSGPESMPDTEAPTADEPDATESPDESEVPDESASEEPATEEPGDEGTDAEASDDGTGDEAPAEDSDQSQTEEADASDRDGADGAGEADEAPAFAPLSESTPDTFIHELNTWYAYVDAGENLDVEFVKESNSGGNHEATVRVRGPGGFDQTCTVPAGAPNGTDCSFADLNTGTAGVWQIDYIDAAANSNRYTWAIDVQTGNTSIDGRVYSEDYRISQFGGSPPVDFSLWYQSEQGFLYQADYFDYHGVNSRFNSDATGVAQLDTCVAAYESMDRGGPNSDTDRLWLPSEGDPGACGDPYKIFFENPDPSMPADAQLWDGSTVWLNPAVALPDLSNLAFTPDSTTTHSGEFTFDVMNFTGQLEVQVDVNNDGDYDDPEDRTLPVAVTQDGTTTVPFDGLDGQGDPIPTTQEINARVAITQAGEIHFVNVDVETRAGLEVQALNGPDAGSTTLYWDDTDLETAGRVGTIPQLDGTAGVDSSGGVHGWVCDLGTEPCNANDGEGGSWGDFRNIDDWTYHTINEFEEITIPGTPPEPWECTSNAPGLLFQSDVAGEVTVNPVDLVTGDYQTPLFIGDYGINATGYNVLDDYVYGWDTTDSQLLQVGSDGLVKELQQPDGFPDALFIGDVDDNGVYWAYADDTWYSVDLATMTADSGSAPTPSGYGQGLDWAFVPGTDTLWRIVSNTNTGEQALIGFNRTSEDWTTPVALPDMTTTGNYGAVYASPDGFLYASHNDSGEIWRVDVNTGEAVHFADGEPSSGNDGARCPDSPILIDLGDAPDGYGTELGSDGPRHGIKDFNEQTGEAPLMLGASIDAETDGFPGPDADGDDNDNVADEDGVAAQIVMADGQETTVSVSATNDTNEDAILAGWIDLDGNGTFDPGELVTETVPAGSGLDSYDLTFPVGTVEADTYARFRLFPDSTDPADILPTGPASAGEVEDYTVTFLALEVDKTSDATEDSRAGDTVTYEVTLTNNGTADYTAANPARYRDDLTDVLDDATLDEGSLSADRTEQPTFDDPYIDWAGALPAGEFVTITYEVELTGEGDGLVRNVAFVPPCDPADPDCDPVTPECDPPDENGRDPQTGLPCAEHEYELPRLEIDKTADKTELPAVGETVTYTVVAENVGPGDYTATAPALVTDDLTEVLDDATFDEASLTANPPGTLDFTDPIVSWEGVLAANETVTIEYTVTYTGEGDQILTNEACVPEDEVAPGAEPCDSIEIPGAFIVDEKSVEASDDPVVAGTVLTYTLTFENEGEAAGTVDKFDDLTHVLDDGDLTGGPTPSDPALSVAGPDADNRLHITGTLGAGEIVTVTYEITVKPDGERGDNQAVNLLVDPGTDPECDPADPDCDPPPCEETDEDCTETLIPEIVDSKEVSASDDPVEAGTVLTYTLTFENEGEAAGTVDKFDDLTHVLDDGDLTGGPTPSDPALSVAGPDADNRLHITGTLGAGEIVTVTYEITVKPDGERGDNQAVNLLVEPGTDPECDPADPDCDPPPCEETDEDCTETLIPEIVEKKSVDPESGSTVLAGDVLTYTLTFENVGEAPGPVDHEDVVAGVLDDAELTDGPTTSDAALSVSGPTDGRFHITGTLDPDQEVTVTYEMTVKPDDERGDHVLENFLVDPGTEPPEECEEDDPTCTENRSPKIVDWKAVDPASGTPVTAGEELTYTVTFTNEGAAAGDVDKVDDLTHILDDADLIDGPTVSDAVLSVSGPDGDGRIAVTGELAADQTVTVTYTVRVKESGERGDDVLANFLLDPDEEPPPEPECEPADDERPDCTRNPVGDIKPSKSVDPESGTEVAAGEELTYTVTFENVGQGADDVDFTDHAADVFDDAELINGPTVSDAALTASGPDGDGRIDITGSLDAGETATVTYTVRVKDHDDQGNNHLGNFVTVVGEDPPEECLDTNPLCTENPIEPPPPDKSGPLPSTGISLGTSSLVGLGLAMLLAGLVLVAATRRNRELATGERSVMLNELF